MDPVVTFFVPCYNLGHLLAECVESILAQTYGDFELLIMDDCSPDQTPEVARSFRDPRVRYIRNERNLGHIANYNKAIGLSRGRYVWLISADDRLRRPYVLERYVRVMEAHPRVGYVFCPAVKLEDDVEAGVMEYTAAGNRDAIFDGREFLAKLVHYDIVSAPSAMARKECYDRVSVFPPDLPYSGDWYLWCVFALHYDVAYLAEPMVNRRYHPQNISNYFWSEGIRIYIANQIETPWRVKQMAEAAGCLAIVPSCREAVVAEYVHALAEARVPMTLEEFDESLPRHAASDREAAGIRARVFAGVGDYYYWRRDFARARPWYRRALRVDPSMVRVWAKDVLLRLGDTGVRCRDAIAAVRRHARALKAGQ